jgi:hypothetical protein
MNKAILSLCIKIEIYLNTFENSGVENIDTSIDLVADKLLGLFNKAFNLGGFGVVDNNTIFRGVIYFGDLDDER